MRFKVDASDLHNWFKEAVGRYPVHEGSDKYVYEDILSNWDRVEPKLTQEFQKFLPVESCWWERSKGIERNGQAKLATVVAGGFCRARL